MDLKALVRNIPDFPKPGILFRDITPLIGDADGYEALVHQMADTLREQDVDVIIGPEARGFIFGAPLAYALHAGFVPARKPGKLPYETIGYAYGLEYGTDELQIHADAIRPGQRVAIVDDLLATGGTALACAKLAEKAGGVVVGMTFAIELTDLSGRETLKDYPVHTILKY
ncbi:MAG: adenine phosphoribosyltransferase [Clostridia bacterium]|nr:adenine phosphoribosyltransferase [Clostridia bacterium]